LQWLAAAALGSLVAWRYWATRERLVSLDAAVWRSERHRLSGRPDAVTRRGRLYIPHEYKSGTAGDEIPREEHVAQLLCYCLLLEEAGHRVTHGMLHYDGNRQFRIAWGGARRRAIKTILADALEDLSSDRIPERLEEEDGRCGNCSVRSYCRKA
jgi:CRISPR-associated protein Cas4